MLAIATILSFAGVLGLYLYSCSIQPQLVQISQIDAGDIGSVVRTHGRITDVYQTSGGDVMLEIANLDNGASITVFIPQHAFSVETGLIPGAEIEVTGEVQEYQGELELVVDPAWDVRVLQPASDLDLTVELLAKNPELFLKREVSVHGQIQDMKSERVWKDGVLLESTAFRLGYSGEYQNYAVDCVILGMDVTSDFHQGQLVRFTGTFEYHENESKYRIVSDEMTLHS